MLGFGRRAPPSLFLPFLSLLSSSAFSLPFRLFPLQSQPDPFLHECKEIHFIRHAEGLHNLDERSYPEYMSEKWYLRERYHDSKLTPFGESQCDSLSKRLETLGPTNRASYPDLVVVSPLSRSIQSAQIVYQHDPQAHFLATELCRERISHYMSDKRMTKSSLSNTFRKVDFSFIESEEDLFWETKEVEPNEYQSQLCFQRAIHFLEWIKQRKEQNIAVVSHWVFLKHLFGLFETIEPSFGDLRLKNAELISTKFCSLPQKTEPSPK